MKVIIVTLLLAAPLLAGCGVKGDPLTPPAKAANG